DTALHLLDHRGDPEQVATRSRQPVVRVARAKEARVADRAVPEDVDAVRQVTGAIHDRASLEALLLTGRGDLLQRVRPEVPEDLDACQNRGQVLHQIDSPALVFQASARRCSMRSTAPISMPMNPIVNIAIRSCGVATFMYASIVR